MPPHPTTRPAAEAPAILQIVPSLETGGAERTTIDMATAIVRRGWRALVASTGGRMADELAAVGGSLVTMPVASKDPRRMALNAAALARLVRREGVALVHARSRAPAWSALVASRLTRVPFVTTYHGAYSQGNAVKGLYNSVMARGDVVIANSAWTARLVARRHGFARERIVTIPRGTDLAGFDPATIAEARTARLRAAWGVLPQAPIILHLARVTPWKGQAVTVEAMRRLVVRQPGAVAVLAGDPQGREGYVEELERRIAAAGLDGRVRLVGHCDDPAAALALAAVAVVPSTEPEAFGRAAVEAQAMGVPVVVADLGAVGETVAAPPDVPEAERTGWRVPPNDPDATAAALAAALDMSPQERAAMAARARTFVASRFTVESMTAATLAVYERLLRLGGGGDGGLRA